MPAFAPRRWRWPWLRERSRNSTRQSSSAAASPKGCAEGRGPPTAGGWRLELLSTLDIEVHAYVRTADGFLTSVHDMLARDETTGALGADIFPSRFQPRSVLRVVNPGARDSLWLNRIDGTDAYCGTLRAGATGATTVPAAELAELGNWQFSFFPSWWMDAMGLLTGADGKLTNLSTGPVPNVQGVRHVPFLPAFAEALMAERQGLVRIANFGDAGQALIVGVDDIGARAGPVTLELAAWQAVHLDSRDLQRGNAAKGLRSGLGSPMQGDWRLRISSDSDIRVTSFVRAPNGFLTSMHDVVPSEDNRRHRVVFFNPGRNAQQVSLLRLANDGVFSAAVTVTAVDDAAKPGGEVRTTVPAGRALTYTAAQLEAGADGLAGRLGTGQGKWRLRVESDEPLTVMSLLASPGGYLTNLSTPGSRAMRK